MSARPNIVYIHSHDTGRHVAPYGHAVETPHLAAFAEAGVLFRQNHTINPTCSASRSALLTGMYPHENGMTGLAHRGFSLKDYSRHLAAFLARSGYRTALSGVQHEVGPEFAKAAGKPVHEVLGYGEYLAAPAEAELGAAKWLDGRAGGPFFLSVGFFETHRTFPEVAVLEDDPRYALPPAPLPDTPETRLDMARFKTSARRLDRKIHVVLEALRRNGCDDSNTLVIITTDHGIAFPRMKCHLHDSGTGVMLMMRGPGGFTGGKVVDAMTTHLDLFPTLCELTGLAAPAGLRGKSLLPLVNGKTASLHEAVFTQVNYHAAYEPMRAVRTDRHKYIRRFEPRPLPVLPNCDEGESKQVWMEAGWHQAPLAQESLFDLILDPNEMRNLINEPAAAPIAEAMRGRLASWMKETADPFLTRGQIPAPQGATVTDADERLPDGKKVPGAALPR